MSKRPDQSTPQAAVEGFKHALTDKNWHLTLHYLTPKAQHKLVGALLMASGYAADGDDAAGAGLATIMKRHGLRKQQQTDIASLNVFNVVRDLMKWSERNLPADRQLDLSSNAANTEYSDYRIDGDRAYVIATCRGRKSETRLKRVEGIWYLI